MHHEDDEEPTRAPFPRQKFAIDSWGDLFAAMSILGMLIAGVAWGLKLEGDNKALRTTVDIQQIQVGRLQAQVDSGVLPLTQERFNRMDDKLQRIEGMMREHLQDHRDTEQDHRQP